MYQKKSFLGFGTVAADCNVTEGVNTTYIITDDSVAGFCNISGYDNQSSCENNMGMWTPDTTRQFNSGNPATDCVLSEGSFFAGAATGVSALNIMYTTNEDGIITSKIGPSEPPTACDITNVAYQF